MWSERLPPTGEFCRPVPGSQVQGVQCCWLQALPLMQPAALPGAITCRAGAQHLPLLFRVRGKLLSMKSEGLEVVFEACRAAAALVLSLEEGSGEEQGRSGFWLSLEKRKRQEESTGLLYLPLKHCALLALATTSFCTSGRSGRPACCQPATCVPALMLET